jgi:HAD superfamily hydrolase (TIGR01509 family)
MTERRTASWRNFIFDFDGTLVDTSPLHAEAYRRVLAASYPRLLAGFDYEKLKGRTTREGFAALGVPAAELDRVTAEKQRLFREAVSDGRVVDLPGAALLLDTLAASHRQLFLVTSGSPRSVTAALASLGWTQLFAGIVFGDDVAQGKPAPDGYRLCLSRHRLSPAASVVVEDAQSGLDAARAAGLGSIAVHDPALRSATAHWFADLTALETWFTKSLLEVQAAS